MDLLIVLTYVVIAWSILKIFKTSVSKWAAPTAALEDVFIVNALILLMSYNHPYTLLVRRAVISILIIPQVTGVVNSVTDEANQHVEEGEVLFITDPACYQARVNHLQANLATALHSISALKTQLFEAQANATHVSAGRDHLYRGYQRYLKENQARVNPFSGSDVDDARQNYLAQDVLVRASVAEQAQIQGQLGSMINDEQSQVTSLRIQLTEAKYNLDQATIRAPSGGYITQVLIRPGTYAASPPLHPIVVFTPEQKRLIVVQFQQNSLLRLERGDNAEAVFNVLLGQVFHGRLVSILPAMPGGSYQA